MTDQEKKIIIIVGAIVLTTAGFFIIPPLMKKFSNRLYKKSMKSESIDFDNMGPEIVKKTNESEMGDEK